MSEQNNFFRRSRQREARSNAEGLNNNLCMSNNPCVREFRLTLYNVYAQIQGYAFFVDNQRDQNVLYSVCTQGLNLCKMLSATNQPCDKPDCIEVNPRNTQDILNACADALECCLKLCNCLISQIDSQKTKECLIYCRQQLTEQIYCIRQAM